MEWEKNRFEELAFKFKLLVDVIDENELKNEFGDSEATFNESTFFNDMTTE